MRLTPPRIKKITPAPDFYRAVVASLTRLSILYFTSMLRFILFAPSIIFIFLFIYALYYPESVAEVIRTDEIQKIATALSHNRGGIIKILLFWFNLSFVVWGMAFKIDYIAQPLRFYKASLKAQTGKGAIPFSLLRNTGFRVKYKTDK